MSTRTISDIPNSSDWRHPARFGYLVIFLTFGVGAGWAAIAKVNSAVMAPAFVSVETNSKVVEHLEGGIIGQIMVTENQHVTQGQVLLRLSDVQAKSMLATVRNEFVAARVQEARLIAQRDQKTEIELPLDIQAHMGDDQVVMHAVADQRAAFDDQQRYLQGQIGVLESHIEGLKTEIHGLINEQASAEKQVGYIEQELVGLRQLLANHLAPLPRVLETERERTRLEGIIGRSVADQAKAQNSIGETELDIQNLRHKLQGETADGIVDIRRRIAELSEKMAVSGDVMSRIEIRSPVSGEVQGLKVYSVGQVIRAGEPLLEVVPADERFVVRAQFAPADIDRVHRASEVEVRFPSFHSRTTPVILGTLESVSADRMNDDGTHQPYYLGLVSVEKLEIPKELRERLRSGMPAEVVATLGERSVLSYLVSPLMEFWQKSLREE
jgi:HlyD family secretion protein